MAGEKGALLKSLSNAKQPGNKTKAEASKPHTKNSQVRLSPQAKTDLEAICEAKLWTKTLAVEQALKLLKNQALDQDPE